MTVTASCGISKYAGFSAFAAARVISKHQIRDRSGHARKDVPEHAALRLRQLFIGFRIVLAGLVQSFHHIPVIPIIPHVPRAIRLDIRIAFKQLFASRNRPGDESHIDTHAARRRRWNSMATPVPVFKNCEALTPGATGAFPNRFVGGPCAVLVLWLTLAISGLRSQPATTL
jgi:hypothetical protein